MKNKNIKLTCLSSECPERFSLCCGAISKSASEPEIMLGVPPYFCSKCGKEFKSLECTALKTRLWYALDNITPTESRMEYAENTMLDLFEIEKQNLLIKILAEMESAEDARACRHILKEYILKEK